MEEDWDLYAVVRSCCRTRSSNSTPTTTPTTSISTTTPPPLLPLPTTTSPILDSCFGLPEKENCLFSSSDLFQPQSPLNELEQLYKPFVPNYQQQQPQQQQPISPFNPNSNPNPNLNLNFNSNPISPLSNLSSSSTIMPPRLQMKPEIHLPKRSISTSAIAPRPKRRKNQQKKVVCQVPAEGLSSDMWAWRKYGQKPIKGSPYPRGYYRCSSSKGCLARKQVERSRTDPGLFIVTYTAEHNHPVPTHRNSLAGSTRHKLSTPASTTNISKPSTSTSPLGLSPTTPLTSSMEEDEEEQSKDGEHDNNNNNNDQHGFSKLEEGLMSDDLFMQLENQEGEGEGEATSSGSFFDDCFTPSPLWFNTTSATAAGSV